MGRQSQPLATGLPAFSLFGRSARGRGAPTGDPEVLLVLHPPQDEAGILASLRAKLSTSHTVHSPRRGGWDCSVLKPVSSAAAPSTASRGPQVPTGPGTEVTAWGLW